MRASALLPRLGTVHRHHCIQHQVLQFKGLDQLRVPYQGRVGRFEVLELRKALINEGAAFFQGLAGTENGCVVLHDALHVEADGGGGLGAAGEADAVEVGDGGFAGVFG